MSVEVVARKDFRDAVRSRWLLGLSTVFVLLVSLAIWFLGRSDQITTTQLVNFVLVKDLMVATLVPLIALVIAYGAIVGERESGSLKLLLSLPHSRMDVVAGKVVGRTGAIAAPLAIGFLVPGLIGALGPLQFELTTYLGFILLTVVLGAAFVSIAVGFSAAVSSNRLAIAGAIGIYFLFVPLWEGMQLPLQFYLGVSGTPGWFPLTGEELIRTLRILNPTGSFKLLANEFVNGTLFASSGEQRWETNGEVAAFLMLAVWIVVPPALGLLRFEEADL